MQKCLTPGRGTALFLKEQLGKLRRFVVGSSQSALRRPPTCAFLSRPRIHCCWPYTGVLSGPGQFYQAIAQLHAKLRGWAPARARWRRVMTWGIKLPETGAVGPSPDMRLTGVGSSRMHRRTSRIGFRDLHFIYFYSSSSPVVSWPRLRSCPDYGRNPMSKC
jgi:hypothetical protein